LITGSEEFREVRNTAIELRLRDAHQREMLNELQETTFENWAKKESFALAMTVVYREGKLSGSSAKFSAPALPADYSKAVKPIAERRGVLAGYRIASLLQEALKP
jgi:hypothetical protein